MSWVLAILSFHFMRNYIQGNQFGIQYSVISVTLIGLLGLAISYAGIPLWFYYQNKPFKFSVNWFPLQDKSYMIKESEEGVLRLSQIGEEVIAVVLQPMGRVDGVDIQLVSSNQEIEFKVDGPLGSSLSSYPNGNGFYTREDGIEELITPVLSVQKDNDIGGGPNPWLYLIDVSDVDYQRPGELSNEQAQNMGEELIAIEVEE
ncbi:hypothetical protein C454_02790 [Haloferax gibbonsii ATCC 33959]|uniref:Uncharacterized protein n=1 Tax=Haloferax gibbonsii (strain ATCC 33959 / DSM 4427 / JCM 8863 / NBRC 102184 / NCIMB 2188 / Ma 2.38) TaxID=1227459 RepID=M0HK42_HALGM|nr:hypothetical protein [Haloferax gibbonsii]ELZ84920.1 hypothetical protein C454_02790 [Haloferax gibbonsii ATCC 33959]